MLVSKLINEYLRPWKLATFLLGTSALIVGALYYKAIDWDIPISLIMAFLCYLTAPLSLRILLEKKWRLLPLMVFFTWFTVDGCYAIYWYFKNPLTLEMMRDANFPASLSLYLLCGFLWVYQGSLSDLISEIKTVISH